MAQESGPFSARRPRETLGTLNQNASALPMPPSAVKRSNSISNLQQQQQGPATTGRHHNRSMSGSRMSLAPGRPSQPVFQRSSSGSNLADMGAPRNSTFGSMGARKSIAPGATGSISTPAHSTQSQSQMQLSTQRRSSAFSARHSSLVVQDKHYSFFSNAPVPAGVPKDPRPLRDRVYQAQLAQDIMDYLTQNNFEMDMKHSLTQRSLSSPTQKDFSFVFQWLYARIDPSHRFQKSVDQEIPPILKLLRYPYEKSITKSQLQAVGSQNWPTLLGMLHWILQLVRMTDQFSTGAYDEASADAGHDVHSDKIIFSFLGRSYADWLMIDDDQDEKAVMQPHIDAMAAEFDKSNAKYVEQLQMLEAEQKSLQNKIDALNKTSSKMAKLDEQIKVLDEDRVKFNDYNELMAQRVEKYGGRIDLINEEIQKVETECRQSDEERDRLQAAVDAKGISVEDIDRLNTERERLQKMAETTAQRLEEAKKATSDKDSMASSKLDELQQAVQEYNSLAYQISLIPASATNAKGQDLEMSVTVNASPSFRSSRSAHTMSVSEESDRLLADVNTGYQPHNLLNLDARGSVKNSIIVLRKEISQRRNQAAEDDMGNKDLLDKIREAIEDKQQEVEGLGHRVRAAEEEFEKTREITNAQKMASDAQIEKLEKELARMRTSLTESVQLMEQREMNTNIEYEQLTLRAASLREELHTEIERMLNDVIKFKVHIQKSLEDYEQFVAEEVERECDDAERDDEDTTKTGVLDE